MDPPGAKGLIARSLVLALGLAGLKGAAGAASGSLSLLSSALDSAMDVLSSAGNYLSLSLSEKPADAEHPYGRGKAQSLAALFQGAVISLSALTLLAESLRRAAAGGSPQVDGRSLAAMAAAGAASYVWSRRLRRAAAASRAPALEAEALHYAMDVPANLAVLVVLALLRLGAWPAFDIALCAVVSAYILRQSAALFASGLQDLLDRRAPPELERRLVALIRSHHPRLVDFHELRTRRSGGRVFVDLHVEIDRVERFEEAHEIAESLADRIKAEIPGADVTVHYDPKGAR